jgi:hypothetical protein
LPTTTAGRAGQQLLPPSTDTPGEWHQRCGPHLLPGLTANHATSLAGGIGAKAVKDDHLLAPTWLAQGRVRPAADRELVLLIRALDEQFAQATGHPGQALAKRLLQQQAALFAFVRQPAVPADNTLAEPSLRPRGHPQRPGQPEAADQPVSDPASAWPQSPAPLSPSVAKPFPPTLNNYSTVKTFIFGADLLSYNE